MSVRTVHECDGCRKIINTKQERYKLNLSTERFWSGADSDSLEINLEFCRWCAYDIKQTLQAIQEGEHGSADCTHRSASAGGVAGHMEEAGDVDEEE